MFIIQNEIVQALNKKKKHTAYFDQPDLDLHCPQRSLMSSKAVLELSLKTLTFGAHDSKYTNIRLPNWFGIAFFFVFLLMIFF